MYFCYFMRSEIIYMFLHLKLDSFIVQRLKKPTNKIFQSTNNTLSTLSVKTDQATFE